MRKLLSLILACIVALPVSAKLTKFILRGWIDKQDYSKTDWQRESVDSVYVSIVRNDTVLVPFKVINGNDTTKLVTGGNLRLVVEGGVGDYSLLLNRDGFEPLRKDFTIASEGQDVIYLRGIAMEEKRENMLNEVEIVGTAIKMVMKGDTIVYDSAAFRLPEGSTLDALIRQLPGAELDADGAITVNGKKVNSLLLNGKDFFKDDPEVALKNLPTYVVDKIKVYDKAGDDDAVSLKSHRLSDSPESENLVMDVTLKAEFSMATIFNVEGGYGPGIYKEGPKKFDHRYLGRAFVVGFGKTYRFSVFGTANNIKNTSRATSENKDWGSGWNQNGELEVAMGGFDVFFNPNDKIEASADLQYSREDIDVKRLTSSTRFYETGNLYSRSRLEQKDVRHHIIANAKFVYRGDNVFINFTPNVDWFRSNSTEFNYNANFNRNPVELSRGAAIDSLFSLTPGAEASEWLKKSVTSTNYQSYRGHSSTAMYPDWLQLQANLYASWRPKNMRGSFELWGGVNDRQQTSRYGRIYYQTLADPSLTPTRREQWNDSKGRNTNAEASLTYDWDKRFIGDIVSRTFSVRPDIGWSMERSFNDKILQYEALMHGFDPADRILPSQTAPENTAHTIDPQNTLNSLFLNNRIKAAVALAYDQELIAPSDSGLNPRIWLRAEFTHKQHFRHLSYNKIYLDPAFRYSVNREDGTQGASFYGSFSSSNKLRYYSFFFSYYYENSLVNMFTLVPTDNTSDPLNVFLGPKPGSDFRCPSSHNMAINFYRYGQKSHISASARVSANISRNSVAQSSVFDPSTGITTHRPVNVNGNWYISAGANTFIPFGPNERWNTSISVSYNHNNSVDFTSSVGAPARSVVRNDNITGNFSISYKLKNGTRFGVGTRPNWQHATSPRPDFATISAFNTALFASIDFYLPWQIEGSTSLESNFRRGYEDSALNTTEWIWNASVQKSILDGALTFKLTAVDILGQLSNVNYYVNAQGRTETWTNNLPRYAMLTVAYRFNFTPNALK